MRGGSEGVGEGGDVCVVIEVGEGISVCFCIILLELL